MFRNFNNIQITTESMTFELLDGTEVIVCPKKEIDWLSEDHQALYGTEGESIFLGGRWLIIRKNQQDIKVFMHKEVRYTINKSLKGSGLFDLNYRKHLRSKFSRTHMNIFYMDSIEKEMSGDENIDTFNDAVNNIKAMAEEYSFGIESKPTVIIAPSWDTDNHILSYIIIKDDVVQKEGAY